MSRIIFGLALEFIIFNPIQDWSNIENPLFHIEEKFENKDFLDFLSAICLEIHPVFNL